MFKNIITVCAITELSYEMVVEEEEVEEDDECLIGNTSIKK